MDVRSRVVAWSSVGLLAFPLPLLADGFAPNTWNEMGRKLGIGPGPGYHAIPCRLGDGLHYQHVTGMLPTPNCLPPAVHYFPTPVTVEPTWQVAPTPATQVPSPPRGKTNNEPMPAWMEEQRKAIAPYLIDKDGVNNKSYSPGLSQPVENLGNGSNVGRSPSDQLVVPNDELNEPSAPDSLREELPPPTLDRSLNEGPSLNSQDNAYDALDDAADSSDDDESLLDDESGADTSLVPGGESINQSPGSNDDDESLLDEAALEPIPMQHLGRVSPPALYRLPPVTAGPVGSEQGWANQVAPTRPPVNHWSQFAPRPQVPSIWQSSPVPYPVVPGPYGSQQTALPAANVSPPGTITPPAQVASPEQRFSWW